MHCASCVANIEHVLKKDKGIVEANVNLVTEKANVKYDPSQIDVDHIVGTIERAGYQAAEGSADAEEADHQHENLISKK